MQTDVKLRFDKNRMEHHLVSILRAITTLEQIQQRLKKETKLRALHSNDDKKSLSHENGTVDIGGYSLRRVFSSVLPFFTLFLKQESSFYGCWYKVELSHIFELQ